MTTALQRFLNIVFILLSPIPVLAALGFFLNERGEQAYAPLVGLLACAPMLILAGVNFIVYKKWTLWHANDESNIPPKKQMLLALIPAGMSLVYALSVMIFYWRDTKPLYLECEVTKSEKKPEQVGWSMSIGIRYVTPRWGIADYWLFEGRGWLSDTPTDLGIMWWDLSSESWKDLLGPFEYHPNTDLSDRRDGGLIVWKDKFVSRGWRFNAKKAVEGEEFDKFWSSKYGTEEDGSKYYEPFDRLTISRETGKYIEDHGEGVCRTSSAPTKTQKPITKTNNKF